MSTFSNISSDLSGFFNVKADQRTADWFLVSNPLYTLGICLSYVYIVKFLGPKLMANRKPFQLKNTLILYNFFQVIFSAWLFYQIGMGGWFTGEYSFRCQPVDYSDKPSTVRMVHASWWKKFDHITMLHVIHHGIMPMSVWFGVKYCPGGHSTFFGLFNTFVHIVMYFYYFLTAFGPQMQKYLWWKKYLTTFQMVQFVAIMVHAFQLLFIDCNYPRVFAWWIGSHAILFFFLFKDFYQKAYQRRKAAVAKSRKETETALLKNGNANGHNYINGAANGIANGKANGVANGATNGAANGTSNGTTNGYLKQNGVIRDASDYYVNGVNGSTEIHQRLRQQ